MKDNNIKEVSRRKYIVGAGAAMVPTLLAGCTNSSGGSNGGGGEGGSNESGNKSGTKGSSESSNGKLHIGFSNFTTSDPFEVVNTQFAKWYGSDLNSVKMSAAAADGSASQQVKDIRNLLRQGVDGLVITAGDSNGLAKVVGEAHDQDVPVFGCDIPVNSKDVTLHVAIQQQEYGHKAGQKLVKTMNKQYGKGKKKRVIEVMMDQNNSNAVLRHRSFNNAIDEHDDVEVSKQIEINGYDASSVETKLNSYLQTDDDVQGLFAPWAGGPVGAIRAFENHDMKHPAGKKGHVSLVNCDATASIIDFVKNGFIDQAVDQPLQFYAPIAIHYMVKYLNNGKDDSVLPKIGDKFKSGDIELETGKHAGAKLWAGSRWAPADVIEFEDFDGEKLGYPYFRTDIPVVDKSNADDPALWGNVMRKIS